ncbi:MAG TPA: 30S ribosomal protein THX, partial [Isosphaeraceae bacterium]|nr:30S ribosomal protein THX [Isosphaeraceae bacterium]
GSMARAGGPMVGLPPRVRPIHTGLFGRFIVGRGDRRTKKGKISRGTFGKSRPKSSNINKKKAPVAQEPAQN